MKKILIIPDRNNLSASLELACEYSLGFEYNDFFNPHVLDNEEEIDRLISVYSNETLPSYCTMHGAFFDVIPFSVDSKIRQISHLRIEQSIELAKKIGDKRFRSCDLTGGISLPEGTAGDLSELHIVAHQKGIDLTQGSQFSRIQFYKFSHNHSPYL